MYVRLVVFKLIKVSQSNSEVEFVKFIVDDEDELFKLHSKSTLNTGSQGFERILFLWGMVIGK